MEYRRAQPGVEREALDQEVLPGLQGGEGRHDRRDQADLEEGVLECGASLGPTLGIEPGPPGLGTWLAGWHSSASMLTLSEVGGRRKSTWGRQWGQESGDHLGLLLYLGVDGTQLPEYPDVLLVLSEGLTGALVTLASLLYLPPLGLRCTLLLLLLHLPNYNIVINIYLKQRTLLPTLSRSSSASL